MFASAIQTDLRYLDYEQRYEKQPSRKLLSNSKHKNDCILQKLDKDPTSFLESRRNEIIYRSAVQQSKKRRIYSNVHLDPKKSGRRFRANDRERRRMESLNDALDALKGCIPLPNSKKRMTKLHILRQACSYIKSLTELLQAAAAELGDEMDNPDHSNDLHLINGLSITQRFELLSSSKKYFDCKADF